MALGAARAYAAQIGVFEHDKSGGDHFYDGVVREESGATGDLLTAYTGWGASRTQIDKAGRLLREYWLAPRLLDREVEDAFEIAWRFRAEFQTPLTKVVMGVRSFVKTEGAPVVVAQLRIPLNPITHSGVFDHPRSEAAERPTRGLGSPPVGHLLSVVCG